MDKKDLGARASKAFAELKEMLKRETPAGKKLKLPVPPANDLYSCAIYLHNELSAHQVPYYFCGGFACITVAMTARTTADIDIAVPSGDEGYGVLLDIFSRYPFITDTDHYLPGSHYFFVESSGRFVEVDGILAGFMSFPKIEEANIIRVGPLQLNILSPAGLLKLKLSSWANTTRRKGPKRNGDMTDIRFIRECMIGNGENIKLKHLQDDEAKGLREWVKEFQDLKQWQELDPSYKG